MIKKPVNGADEKPTNPKDAMGALKLDPTLIPTSALIGVMECMANGAQKYGPYNWRNPDKKVGMRAYIGAAVRHLLSRLDGEDVAPDSGLDHIDHAISGLMVLRDAERNGYVIDDRPNKGNFGEFIENDFKDKKFNPENGFGGLVRIDKTGEMSLKNHLNANSHKPKWHIDNEE